MIPRHAGCMSRDGPAGGRSAEGCRGIMLRRDGMKIAGSPVGRMVKVSGIGSLRRAALGALAALLVLVMTACGSSEPDRAAGAADIAAAVEEAVSKAAPTNRLTPEEVRKIMEDSTASRLTAADVQRIVEASAGQQLTAADVQKIVSESAAGQLTAADVQRIADASAGKPLTAADVQKAVEDSAGSQLTAADVQKIVDAASKQLTAADVQKMANESISQAVEATEKAAEAAAAAQQEAQDAAEVSQLALARLPNPATSASQGSPSSGASAAQQAPPTGQGGPAVKQAAGVPPVSRPSPVSPPPATTFQDYQRSRFASTVEDSVSTFSLDTDRTSFQLALTWARAGHAVEPDSVRAEEWINAFDYNYPPPPHQDSFAITTDVSAHPLDGRMHLVRLGFQAPELQDDKPLNVTLVLDASGSMADGNRVDIARAAAESIRRSLGRRDRIGVVHFTTDVIDELTVEHAGPDDRDVRRSIDRLAPHGSTNVQAGLDLGVKLADRVRRERPEAYNYIILMSDGVANVDATDPFAILESAYDADSGNPLRLITIGVGINNYNDYLLEQLAQHGNGWYRYLSDTEQARATFGRESWLALSTPFADQTRAQVTWNDQVVESWRMIGYENRVTSDESFVEDRKEFAEIPVGAATTVFYEVRVRDDVLGQAVRVGRAWGRAAQVGSAQDGPLKPSVRLDGVPAGRRFVEHRRPFAGLRRRGRAGVGPVQQPSLRGRRGDGDGQERPVDPVRPAAAAAGPARAPGVVPGLRLPDGAHDG